MSTDDFREEQKFNQNWMYMLVTMTAGVMLWALYQEYGTLSSWSELNEHGIEGLVVIAITLLVLALMFLIKLHTLVDQNGVTFMFRPFITARHFRWGDIESATVVEYSPLREFLGWGIRYNGKTWAYTINGSFGLRLKLKNGNCILVGTQEPLELKKALGKHWITD